MAGKRSTEAEARQREYIVTGLLVEGKSRSDICEYVSKNTDWEVSDSQIDRYIKGAKDHIGEMGRGEREYNYNLALNRLNLLFSIAMERGEIKTTLGIMKEMNKLQNLYVVNNETEPKDLSSYLTAMLAYAEAIKKFAPVDVLLAIVEEANNSGIVKGFIKDVEADIYTLDMAEAVIDYKELGRGRTREELLEAGYFETKTAF